jgi:hypothetical protein
MVRKNMFRRTGRNVYSGCTELKTPNESLPMSGTSIPPPSTSTTPPTKPTTTHALRLEEWGWKVALRKTDGKVALEVETPGASGYSLTVDEDGNVTELIQGNYVRIVMGSSTELTMGDTISDSGGPNIVRSDSGYVALTAPKVHFNPQELKGSLPLAIPEELKES